jgi:FAD/FMN-containing dehydrogenase
MEDMFKELAGIVGERYVSNQPEERFIYSRDMGTMDPSYPDFVVMPNSTEEVRRIVLLANRTGTALVPMGGGLTLSGLCRPLRGGIVLDMKRMNRIIEVNEAGKYALVEAGTSQGVLQAYLQKHHPALKHSIPDAPPVATIAGNVLIHGSGHISALGGFHSEMLNGLEVVLPTGDVVRVGSCAASPLWFSRSPLPDLSGLFLGWAGTTGVVTKLAIKLYPKRLLNDVRVLVTEDAELMTEIILAASGAQVAEDIVVGVAAKPNWMRGFQMLIARYGADTKKELTLKRDLLRESVRTYIDKKIAGFMPLPAHMREDFLEAPQRSTSQFADIKKGGGFEYVGAIMPAELFGKACRNGIEIAERFGMPYSLGARIIGLAHCMMFFFAYPFNRADEADVKNARQALEETNEMVLEAGGLPWKAEASAQKQIIRRMDPNTFALVKRLREVLDPNGIMNPGNWEPS